MADYDLQYQDTHIDALLATANELKTAGYIYKGVATPSTNPGTPTERVAYLASEPGTYTNFGGIVITSGLYSLTYASGTWTATQMSAGSDIEVVQTIGDSTTNVMSQKAVTDEVNAISEYRSIEENINISALTEKNGLMGSATQWLTPKSGYPRRHVSIAVTPGDVYEITAPNTHVTNYACMTYDQIPTTNLQAIALCNGCIREIVEAGTSVIVTIPNDCTYLAIGKTNNTTGDYAPQSVFKLSSSFKNIQSVIRDIELEQEQLSSPKFFSPSANWDVVNTQEVRYTLLSLEVLTGNLPTGSRIRYMGGATNTPNIFCIMISDANNNTISSFWGTITYNGDIITLYTYGKVTTKCVINTANIQINKGSLYDYGNALLLNIEYLNGYTPKKIMCFGDSITEFKDSKNMRYSDYLARLSGCDIINCGIGATQLAQRVTPSATPATLRQAYAAVDISSLITAWVDNDWTIVDASVLYLYNNNHSHDYRNIVATLKDTNITDIDIITIFGGTNDLTTDVTNLGVPGSTNIQETAGGIYTIINKLQTANPNIEIFFFTPIVRYVVNTRTEANWSDNYVVNDRKLPDVVNCIVDNCNYYHVPCRNWYWDLGWTRFNFSNYFNDNDGTHPYKGFKYLGIKMYEYLKTQTLLDNRRVD